MDQNKIERVLKLMKLLTGNVEYSIEELAEKLETSPRTIYRYIDTFKAAGFAVIKQDGTFALARESRFFKDISQLVHFTEEEAYMVNSLIDGLDNTNVIKENLRSKLATIYNLTSIAEVVVKKANASNVNNLIEAIEEEKQVLLKGYSSGHSKKKEDRLVEPFQFTTNYINVWCYDPKDNKNKLFKTERIAEVEVLNEKQKFTQKHSSGFIDIFRMHGDKPVHIKLELGMLSHNLLTEEFPLSEKHIKKINDKKWLLSTDIANIKGAARFVMGTMDDIKIIEGDALKKYIREFVSKHLSKI